MQKEDLARNRASYRQGLSMLPSRAAIIKQTTDYSMFTLCEFNRNIGKTEKLEREMARHGWIDAYPMHVVMERGKLAIKAGHHRFVVARKLGIPVKYVLCDDNISVHELELATSRWALSDYLVSYARQGIAPYREVKEYHDETGIPLACCLSMLAGESAGSNNWLKRFKQGTYQIAGTHHADEVAAIVLHCRSHRIKFAQAKLFIEAISKVMFLKKFDPERFKKKILAYCPSNKPSSLVGYLNMIEEIYNRGASARARVPLAFLADKAARERNPARSKK